MKDRAVRNMILFFAVISAVLVGIAVVAVGNISRSAAASDWVNHTHAVIEEVGGAVGSLQAADGALRTYAVTGDPRDQAAAKAEFGKMEEHLDTADALTRRDPDERRRVERLAELALRRANLAPRVYAVRRSGDQAGALRALVEGEAEASPLSEVERVADEIVEQEMGLLADRDTASYLQAQTTRWTVWLGVAVDVCLLGGVGWVIRDALASRRRAAAILEEANAKLEERVRARTAELASANERLTIENMERKWANQALEHQLRYNLLIVNSINDGVLVLTKILNISRVNPAVTHLTGWEPPDLVNRPLSSVVRLDPAGGEDALRDPLAQALKSGRDLREQSAVMTDRKGRAIPVRLTLYPLRDRDKVVGGVVILRVVLSSS